jgi:hypothetical protein
VLFCVCVRARVCVSVSRERKERASFMDGWMDDSIGVSKSNHVMSSSVST